MIETGTAEPLGAVPDRDGVNFAVYSSTAEAIDLCLFDNGTESRRLRLPGRTGDTWHGRVPGCGPGQAYGYRVHGRYAPESGIRSNPNKLLLDPRARRLDGAFTWTPAVFDYACPAGSELVASDADSAPFVPKSVVTGRMQSTPVTRPAIPWRDMIIYEANVRGYTMCHPGLGEAERGLFRGMRNGEILDYLSALGITSLELMPVFEFIDERHLVEKNLRNLWGYNAISFFAPASRYLGEDDILAFREMVDAIHDAGIEVILDVAYNHTGEGDRLGPSICFRGLDNRTYYRLDDADPAVYVDETGCGNTLNTDHPVVQELVRDSLRYWSAEMAVDGFRFDLATVLGRSADGFRADHPLIEAITSDSSLADLKLIAEPWDIGPDGYQLGGFPRGWGEWNDRYRDDVRRFWRGDERSAANLARRLHGSADIFEPSGRGPASSINFVSCHDGFTLADLVSFESRHNHANGEDNQDGHRHNYSDNCGVEGETADPDIRRKRRARRLNLLGTLLYSQGTPMLLGGDEFGNSQDGNNNAYAQDNEVGWVDWAGLAADPSFVDTVREMIRTRQSSSLLRQASFRHGNTDTPTGRPDIAWYLPDGQALEGDAWHGAVALALVLTSRVAESGEVAVAVLVNAAPNDTCFHLPATPGAEWRSGDTAGSASRRSDGAWRLQGDAVALLVERRADSGSGGQG